MQSITRKSPELKLPDNVDAKRELFIKSMLPHDFIIEYYNADAITKFDSSSEQFLPFLPWGYHWEKIEEQYSVYKLEYANEHSVKLILYGPDEKGQINYNLLIDGNNVYSLSHTRKTDQNRLGSRDRKYPSPINGNASGYVYSETHYMPGHCVDHVDSIIPPPDIVSMYGARCNSSYNPANYIPEIQKSYWGLTMRTGLVIGQRKNNLSYAQLAEYPDDYKRTISGAAIPESVYFYCLDRDYRPTVVSCIDWEMDYNQQKKPKGIALKKHMESFSTSLEAAPTALLWDVNNTDRAWRNAVRDKRKLGHNIRKEIVESYHPDRDQIYAYGNSSALEFQNIYSSISAAFAATDQSKSDLAEQNLAKAVEFGLKLRDLDEAKTPINGNRYDWFQRYNADEKPGFSDERLDTIRQLSGK